MERQSVDSSNIESVGYNPVTNLLEVEFKNGGVYQYANVPPGVFDALMDAGSKGSYLHKYIKGKYATTKI